MSADRVAIKLLARGGDCATLLRGIENHLELSHPHIIDIKEVRLCHAYDVSSSHSSSLAMLLTAVMLFESYREMLTL